MGDCSWNCSWYTFFFSIVKPSNTIRVVQYNIGKYNYGRAGGLASDVSQKITNYNSFFTDVKPEFLFLQEYVEYIDSAKQYKADDNIFDSHFAYESYSEKETIIKGNKQMTNTAFSYLHTTGDHPAWCIYGTTSINNKTIAVVSGVLNVSAPEGVDHQEQGIRALTKLTTQVLNSYDNVIIGMDCNCMSKAEADVFKEFMKGKGYQSANWNYFGYKNTYNLAFNAYKAIDNVFVKGSMRITNFIVPNVYSLLSSDHFPIIVDIAL